MEKTDNLEDNSFLKKEGINDISQKEDKSNSHKRIDRNQILDYIRKHAPLTKYKLSKELNIAYGTISQICREFEFAQLIDFKIVLGDNNRTHVLIVIPEKDTKLEVKENE